MGKLAVPAELDDLALLAVFVAAQLGEPLARRAADHAVEVALGHASLFQRTMDDVHVEGCPLEPSGARHRPVDD